MVNPALTDPLYHDKLQVKELARRNGLLLDNDEILVIYQNVRYILNQKYEILSQMKASEFEIRMFKAALPLHGQRPGEYRLSVTQRDKNYEPMMKHYMSLLPESTRVMMEPIISGILIDLPNWRKKNSDVAPI